MLRCSAKVVMVMVHCCKIVIKILLFSHSQTHELTHTGERPYKCDECGITFLARAMLIRHRKVMISVLNPFFSLYNELKYIICLIAPRNHSGAHIETTS